jgi:hypothetical protein
MPGKTGNAKVPVTFRGLSLKTSQVTESSEQISCLQGGERKDKNKRRPIGRLLFLSATIKITVN